MRALAAPGFTRAFRNRNFRIYVAGNALNLIALWMQRIAVGWLIWQLTHSGAWLGAMSFAELCPSLLIGPFAGVVVDRRDRLRLARVTQFLALLQSIMLTTLILAGMMTAELLLVLMVIQGIIFSFWQPVRLALVPNLVAREDLAAAVSANSIVFNSARFIGPALAGVVIVLGGVGWAFAGYSLSLAGFQIALLFIRLPAAARPAGFQPRFLTAIRDGFVYAAKHPDIGPLLLLMFAGSVCLRSVFELLPGFAAGEFGQGAEGLSAMAAVTGLGAVAGGVWLGQRNSIEGLAELVLNSTLLLAGCLLLFAVTGWFWLALIELGVAGFTLSLSGAGTQTLVQSRVDEALRGRVLSLYGMIIRGGPALGALAMGVASERWGLRAPLAVSCVLASLAWGWLWRRVRRRQPRQAGA